MKDKCSIETSYAVKPDSTIGIAIKLGFNGGSGLEKCYVTRPQYLEIVEKELKNLKTKEANKSVSTVFIGWLSSYEWIEEYLSSISRHPLPDQKLNKKARYNYALKLLAKSEILDPFNEGLKKFDLKTKNIECEKMSYFDSGVLKNGSCWLRLAP